MSGDVIITVTLNTALQVSYRSVAGAGVAGGVDGGPAVGVDGTVDSGSAGPRGDSVIPVSRPAYLAGGRGVTVARVLRAFGHDVLAAGLAGGTTGELIGLDLARSGVPAAFTQIRGESRRIFRFAAGAEVVQYGEPGPYITTEELGRFAGDYRKLLGSAAAVVLCGSLPEGLPPDMYATLVRYAAEAGVPVILDAGGEELLLAVRNHPALVIADSSAPEAAHDLLRLGAAAVAVVTGRTVHAVTPTAQWTAHIPTPAPTAPAPTIPTSSVPCGLERGALVAGLVPGELLSWSWPDRLRHALALAAGAADAAGEVDSSVYETLLDSVAIQSLP
jgi:tagatose 6-phosphate kinase